MDASRTKEKGNKMIEQAKNTCTRCKEIPGFTQLGVWANGQPRLGCCIGCDGTTRAKRPLMPTAERRAIRARATDRYRSPLKAAVLELSEFRAKIVGGEIV